MRVNVKGTEEGAEVEIVQPGTGGPETDQVLNTVKVPIGNELLLNVPNAATPSDIEYGNVVGGSGEPTPTESPTDPESPGPNAGDEPPAPGGEGTGGEGTGGQGGGETPAPPTTSAASEKPLYLVDGDTVPQGFAESGLETPDGKTLFHFGTDVAGGPTTGNADGVSVYAESADDTQPVVAAVVS